jgi:hypothetical protein
MYNREDKISLKHWTEEEDRQVREMLHRYSPGEIAQALGRSEIAVRQYIHRERLPIRGRLKKNLVIEMLRMRFIHPEFFMPNRKFYKDLKINQNRWWRLYRGEEKPTDEECRRLVEYLELPADEFFKKRQLEIDFNL